MTHKLAVLYTNDIHSHFEKMPKISSAIHKLRKKHGEDRVVTLDIGDHMDRMRIETEGTSGRVNVEVMNACGYEAFVFGNNEGLTFTPAMTADVFSNYAQFPVIGSNIVERDTQKRPNWMEPYTIIEKNGLRIGLIGVTVDFNTFYEMLGWHVCDPIQTVGEFVAKLRDRVDLLFVMSHLGLPRDQEMARRIDGIDCIFGAHTHHLFETPHFESGTYFCATGKFGEYVGELEIEYDLEKQQIVSVSGKCHYTEQFEDDAMVSQIIAHYRAEGERRLGQKAAFLKEPLMISWEKESRLGNLLAGGLKQWTDAEIGLVNSGQILHSLDEGAVTKKRLLEICPSPINPCRMTLTGGQLRKTLEESLVPEYIHLPIRGFGFRGKVLGTISLSGAVVTYDWNRPDYEKIVNIEINGEPLQDDQDYTVGTIDMFTFGLGYLTLQDGRDVTFFLPEFIRDVLESQLNQPECIEKSKQTHWIASS